MKHDVQDYRYDNEIGRRLQQANNPSESSHIPLPGPEQFKALKPHRAQLFQVKIVHADGIAFL
jgi:hypothetical protein